MQIHEAVAIKEATRNVTNRSAWIVDACLRKARGQEAFDVAELPSRQLMAVLTSREDVPQHIRDLLMQNLTENAASALAKKR
jgi:hypothetical protein